MSRLTVLRRHPKRTLSGLTVALAAIGVAVGSGATFSSSSATGSNVFTAGTLHHTNTKTGALATATISGIKPGFGTLTSNTDTVDTANTSAGYGSVVLASDGNLPSSFTVVPTESSTAGGSTTFCGGTCSKLDTALSVKIVATDTVSGTPATPVTVYNGLVSGLGSAHLGDGTADSFTMAAGDSRKYEASFFLPYSAGNALQGGSATVALAFNQVQQ